MRHRWFAAGLLLIISTLVGASGVASSLPDAIAGADARRARPSGSDLPEEHGSLTPVVELPSRGARAKSGDPRDLDELITSLASRTRFELQLPDPALLDSRTSRVVWWERGGVVVAVQVVYERSDSSAPGYWLAGQMANTKEDARWKDARDSKPIATRFWKYRMSPREDGAVDGGGAYAQFYRFHDGVESWVGGQLTEPMAAQAVASLRPVQREGISPLVVLAIGVVLIFVWPGYAAWSAKRKYDAKRDLAAANDDRQCGPAD